MKRDFARLFSRRLLGIHVFGIVAFVACLALSNWQWDRARVWSDKSPDSLQVIQPFDQLSPLRNYLPETSIGARTQISGTWVSQSVRTYCNRPMDGAILRTGIEIRYTPGCWVTGVIELSDNTVFTVVLGWSQDNSGASGLGFQLPSGKVELLGRLQPSEDSHKSFLTNSSQKITTDETVKQFRRSAHDGYLVLDAAPSGLKMVQPIYELSPSQTIHWRNVVYTINWLVFAAFVFFMWWRAFRDELATDAIDSKEERMES